MAPSPWRVTCRIALGFETVIDVPGDDPGALVSGIALPVMLGASDDTAPRLVALIFTVDEIDETQRTAIALLSGWEERSPSRRTRKRRKTA